jgi:hypothetical protein
MDRVERRNVQRIFARETLGDPPFSRQEGIGRTIVQKESIREIS